MMHPLLFLVRGAGVWALALGLLPPADASAQSILGAVLDRATGEPIPNMEVVVRAQEGSRIYRSLADDAGRFRVTVDTAGVYVIALSRLGYDGVATTEVVVEAGKDLVVHLRVEPSALGLDPIRVVVPGRSLYLEAEGFYRRKERGWGEYMEHAEIQAYPSTWASHVLRRMGIGFRDGRMQGCRLLVDGMELDWDLRLDDMIAKEHMSAVEIYGRGGHVPVELRGPMGRSGCVVVLWTTWGESLVGPPSAR